MASLGGLWWQCHPHVTDASAEADSGKAAPLGCRSQQTLPSWSGGMKQQVGFGCSESLEPFALEGTTRVCQHFPEPERGSPSGTSYGVSSSLGPSHMQFWPRRTSWEGAPRLCRIMR